MTDQSLVKIGEIIGKRDHSTVIHGIEKIEKDLDKDPELSKVIDVITKKWINFYFSTFFHRLSTFSVDNLWISCVLVFLLILVMLINL